MLPFKIVAATRADEQEFQGVALGKCLHKCYPEFPVEKRIFFGNTNGLPICYNQAIREAAEPEQVIVFVHDDVHLLDFFWTDHLMNGLESFDIVGVAGNRRRVPRQSSWAFIDDRFTWDAASNLSGRVAHGREFPFSLTVYGPSMQQCQLLDGVLLAARAKTLKDLFFDERFDFHFYDMDLCRQAEQKKLKLGTVPISLAHESGGDYGSAWRNSYNIYLDKWGD